MAKAETCSYRDAEAILEDKNLLSEVDEIINSIKVVKISTRDTIKGLFSVRGWEIEKNFLRGTAYAHDAFKREFW